ncbi:MAG: rod shape-determining protein RodA [Clostridiales bacterium]|nr:rod shape-determining protein RodA [Clostridiales bacterium]
MMMTESRRYKAHFDIVLCLLVYTLAIFGVLAVTVATYSVGDPQEASLLQRIVQSTYGSRQGIFLLISPVVLGVVVSLRYESLRLLARPIYYFSVLLLGVVLFTSQSSNVKAWMGIWDYTLQPSEFVKIGLIMLLAKVLASNEKPMSTMKDFIRIMGILILPSMITMAQGEMGSVLVMVVIFAVMLYFGGVSLKILFSMAAVGVVAIFAIYGLAKASGSDNYRLMRILAFINPADYASSGAYQQSQSIAAVGSGGREGIGVFVDGSMSQLNFVPEDWTDFIFSSIGEAFGFIGCTILIVVYLAVVIRLLYLARFTRDKFGRLIIIGVMAMIFFHVFQNVAMAIGLMPITGIPLPFVSYGGSNLITNMGGIGLVLNVVKNRSLSTPVQTPQLNVRKYGRIRGLKKDDAYV